jgi:hypothetical protein
VYIAVGLLLNPSNVLFVATVLRLHTQTWYEKATLYPNTYFINTVFNVVGPLINPSVVFFMATLRVPDTQIW